MTSKGERRAIDKMSSCSRRRRRRTKREKGLVCGGTCSSVSDKLIALKSLIPTTTTTEDRENNIVKADQLFQETANYIVHLKAQVLVLQRLIEFYGSSDDQVEIDAAAAVAVL